MGLIVGLTLYLSPQVVIRENIEIEKPDGQIEVVHAAKEIKATQTTIPFFKSNNFDYADLVGFMGEHVKDAMLKPYSRLLKTILNQRIYQKKTFQVFHNS